MSKKEEIQKLAVGVILENPNGIRYSDLVRTVKEKLQEVPVNTIHGSVWDIATIFPREIYKPARGLFRHTKYATDAISKEEKQHISKKGNAKPEQSLYSPFADYLVNELEECTKAIELGGNRFKDKWGTPDVIGLKKPMPSDIIKSEIEIVSAEIKSDTSSLITAFGQACAYKTFSHKVYIVIPKEAPDEDKSRVESLSLIFGIGLVFHNKDHNHNLVFEIRVRPQKYEPDSFYVNRYMKLIEAELFN